jgi:hypothetical protein
MLGDKRPLPIMLVVSNLERLRRWARHRALPLDDVPALLAHPDVQAKMADEVTRVLGELASFEWPKKLLLLPKDFSLKADELTSYAEGATPRRGGAASRRDRGAVPRGLERERLGIEIIVGIVIGAVAALILFN